MFRHRALDARDWIIRGARSIRLVERPLRTRCASTGMKKTMFMCVCVHCVEKEVKNLIIIKCCFFVVKKQKSRENRVRLFVGPFYFILERRRAQGIGTHTNLLSKIAMRSINLNYRARWAQFSDAIYSHRFE